MNLSAITEADIQAAAMLADLDAACRALQEKAGITDGGVAALFFSDVAYDWAEAGPVSRAERLRAWLKLEAQYKDGDDVSGNKCKCPPGTICWTCP